MGFSYERWGFPTIFPLNSNDLSLKITELTGDVFGSAGMILRSRHSCEQVTARDRKKINPGVINP